jgi:hypothetical protein
MRNVFLQLLFGFYAVCSFGQFIVVVDASDKKPLAFVTLNFGDSGSYTNEFGFFKKSIIGSENILRLTHLGYAIKELNTLNLNDTIFLMPENIKLDEIVVSQQKGKTEYIDISKSTSIIGNFPLLDKFEIVLKVEPLNNLEYNIEKVTFYFEKINTAIQKNIEKKYKDVIFEEGFVAVRVNIYGVTENYPNRKIYESQPIKISANTNEKITLDVTTEFIQLNSKGLFFSLELMNIIDYKEGVVSKENRIRPKLTKQKSKKVATETYTRAIFSSDRDLKPISIYLNFNEIKSSRNLAVSLVITQIEK